MPMRLAVAISGRGSNLAALLGALPAAAPGLDLALRRGIPTRTLADPADGKAWLDALAALRIDLVVLAGYLRLVPPAVVERYRGRIVNIHPALLPGFGGPGMYGRRVHEAVIASGVRTSGATVHLVDEVYDRGAVLAQERVPV